jgi:hypothetical protein
MRAILDLLSWFNQPEVWVFLIGVIATIMIAAITGFYSRRIQQRKDALIEQLKSRENEFFEFVKALPDEGVPEPQFVRYLENQIAMRVASSPGLSDEEVKSQFQTQLQEVGDRIAKIENRFPEESKIEKIASINDALLSERIDQLSKQLENIEKKILTKWDVAVLVSMMIGGIAFVVAATYSVLRLLPTTPFLPGK